VPLQNILQENSHGIILIFFIFFHDRMHDVMSDVSDMMQYD